MAEDERPRVRVVSAEVQRDGGYLITQRLEKAVLPNLWEFPGGRVRDGEDDEAALRRTLKDRLGVDSQVVGCTMEVFHDYEGYSLTQAVYRCELSPEQEPQALKVQNVAWVAPDALGDYEFPGADQRTVDALLEAD